MRGVNPQRAMMYPPAAQMALAWFGRLTLTTNPNRLTAYKEENGCSQS